MNSPTLKTFQTYELPSFRSIGKDVIFVESHHKEVFCDPHIFDLDYDEVVKKAIKDKEPEMLQGNRTLYFRLDWFKAMPKSEDVRLTLPFFEKVLDEFLKYPSKEIEVVLIDEITGYGQCYG